MGRLASVFAFVAASTACSGGGGSASGGAPARPTTGAPIAFEVEKVTPGGRDTGAIAVKAYNFSDRTIAGYGIVMRYRDKDRQVVKVGVGTAFEKDFDFWSMSGRRYQCAPRSWCGFTIDRLEIPAAVVSAEVLATSVRALKPDGQNFEDADLWHLPGGSTAWPGQ